MKNEKCASCWSCGMPMKDIKDIAYKDGESTYCSHCIDKDGNLLSYEEILRGTVNFYMQTQGIHELAARGMAQELLSSQPQWKK